MRYFILLILLGIFPISIQAQIFNLPSHQQVAIYKYWNRNTPQVNLTHQGKQVNGQIIYTNDSGIVWRNVPQYIAYTKDNVAFIPFGEIEGMEIKQPWKMGERLAVGALTGGFLSSSLVASFPNNRRRWVWSSDRYYTTRIANFIRGASIGAVIGAINAFRQQKDQHLYFNDQKDVHLFYLGQMNKAALYPQRKLKENSLIIRDSIITGIGLPDELAKLKEIPKGKRWEISIGQGSTDLWGTTSISPPLPNIGDIGIEIYSENYYHYQVTNTPSFYEISAMYRITPFLKAGIQTMKIDNDYNSFRTANSQIWFNLQGSRSLNHGRSWGLVTEFTPFPTRFMNLRRWDVNVGAGVFTQNVELGHNIEIWSFGQTHTQSTSQKHIYQSALTYGGITYYVFPWLNVQTRFGRYFSPTISSDELVFDSFSLAEDIIIAPEVYPLSWNYYSFRVNVRF